MEDWATKLEEECRQIRKKVERLGTMDEWKARMVEEYKQVRDRAERLRITVYEQEEGTAQNSERELHLMRKQLDAMETYMCCLMRRAARNGIDLRNV